MIDPRPEHGCLDPLEMELERARAALPLGAVRLLEALGVPIGIVGQLTGAGALGRVRTAIGKGGRWEPVEDGEPRLIVAVREKGVLVDLVAMSSSERDSWALRTGAGWLLGYEHFHAAQLGGEDRLRLFGNPVEWMAAGGEGICVLDWSRTALSALRGLGSGVAIACDNEGAAEALTNALRWGGLPRVAVDDFRGREVA